MIQQKIPPNSQAFHLFLKICFLSVCVLFYSFDIVAQPFPESFTISGCSSMTSNTGMPPITVNGDYIRGAVDSQTCPCYENLSNNAVVTYLPQLGGIWYVSEPLNGSCSDIIGSGTLFYKSATGADACDISLSVLGNASFYCDPATTLSNVVYPPPTTEVPTLSEWGLIVLALLLMTLGTLYLLQPNFGGQKEA